MSQVTVRFADDAIRVEKDLENIARVHWPHLLKSERSSIITQAIRTKQILEAFILEAQGTRPEAKCQCTPTLTHADCKEHRNKLLSEPLREPAIFVAPR